MSDPDESDIPNSPDTPEATVGTKFLIHIYGPSATSTYELSLQIAEATKNCVALHDIAPEAVLYYTTGDNDFKQLEILMSTGCCMQHLAAPATIEGAAELINRIDEMLAAHSSKTEQMLAADILNRLKALSTEGGEVV